MEKGSEHIMIATSLSMLITLRTNCIFELLKANHSFPLQHSMEQDLYVVGCTLHRPLHTISQDLLYKQLGTY
jgi:hypothetical protein